MNIRCVATSLIFCTLGFTFSVQASSGEESAIQAALNGNYSEAIDLFKERHSSLSSSDHEELMHIGTWLGLTHAAENKNDGQSEKALISALCIGLPEHYIEEARLNCEAKSKHLITSDLNADMLATGLAMLATQQLMTDEARTAYRYLSVANKVLLEPPSRIKHVEITTSRRSDPKRDKKSYQTFHQLVVSVDAEEQKNKQQLMSMMLAGGKADPSLNSLVSKNMRSLVVRKQIIEMLKKNVCSPRPKTEINLMAFQQQMSEEDRVFIEQATNLAKKMDPEKDCGVFSRHAAKHKTLSLPRKELDERKTFHRFAEKHICKFNEFNSKPVMNRITESIKEHFSVAMEAKRGTAMRGFNIANKTMVDDLIQYYKTVEKLEIMLNQIDRKNDLRRKIVKCGESDGLLFKLRNGLASALARGEEKDISYYEKTIAFALYIQKRNENSSLRAYSSLIYFRKIMAEQYIKASLPDKAALQYREISVLMRQGKPHHQEITLQVWTSALISYGNFIKNSGGSIQEFLALTEIVATKQKTISDRLGLLSTMGKQERIQHEIQEHIETVDEYKFADQMDINKILKEQGMVLPADKMADLNARFSGIKKQMSELLTAENLTKFTPKIQAKVELRAMQDDNLSMDMVGTQIEERWDLLNQHRQFQLGMAQAYITADQLKEAKQWLERSPYHWEEMQNRYSNKILAIEGYVTGLYHQALNEHKLASQYFRGAVEYWYFNPVNALDALFETFPSNTFLLEQAAEHEIQYGNPSTAFTYIEIARQANLGNPRLYGYVSAERLNHMRREIEHEYSQLLALAKKNAATKTKHAKYTQALARSNKQRTGSVRETMGPLLPLYTGLEPMLPWLKDEDFQEFMKRMEIFHTLASNQSLDIYRSSMLVKEKQHQLDEKKHHFSPEAENKISTANILSSNKTGNWLDIDAFDKQQKNLNLETTILSYWLTNENLYVFSMNHEKIQADIFSPDDIYADINDLSLAYDDTIARELYQKLIAPYKGTLKKHLVIMANGALKNIPFAALPHDGESTYLGDRFLIRYAPGIEYAFAQNAQAMLPKQANNKLKNKLLMLAIAKTGAGSSDLKAAKVEAETIAPLFQTDIFLDKQVTRSLLSEKISQYSMLHYAGHAKLDEEMPDFSRLILAKDDTGQSSFYVNDIKKLPLQNLQLVVLAACESRKTNVFNLNNEFSTLNSAFLEAGAASVIASPHMVDDDVAARFMMHFYEKLKNGASKARAVQLAQKYVRENYPEPKDWAAFVLSGQEGYL